MTRLIMCPSGRQAAVSVPMGVIVIGAKAFQNCAQMAGVSLPPTVRVIEDDAFWDCDGLTSVELPVGLEKIEGNPFASCGSNTHFVIPEANPWFCTVDGILCDKALTRVIAAPAAVKGRCTLPETAKVIERVAFMDCQYGEIILPEGLAELGIYAFDYCYSIKRISIPEGVVEIPVGCLTDCFGLEHVELPSTLTTIGKYAFKNCESLRHLTIPAGVTGIDDTAFEECENLTLHGTAGSNAEQFAAERGIPFTTEVEPGYDPNAASADAEPEDEPEEDSTDAAYGELKKGSKGDAVKALQQKLIELGFLTGKADGDYGNKTAKAVSAFQKSAGLSETGIADSNTQAKLFE